MSESFIDRHVDSIVRVWHAILYGLWNGMDCVSLDLNRHIWSTGSNLIIICCRFILTPWLFYELFVCLLVCLVDWVVHWWHSCTCFWHVPNKVFSWRLIHVMHVLEGEKSSNKEADFWFEDVHTWNKIMSLTMSREYQGFGNAREMNIMIVFLCGLIVFIESVFNCQ